MLIRLLIISLTAIYSYAGCPCMQNIQIYPHGSIQAILTDIEGTTTAISFVHDVLFPYAKKNLRQYVIDNHNDPAVVQALQETREIAGATLADQDQLIEILLTWIEQDKKVPPLKTLQGMMWQAGYEQGDFQGHVYEDVSAQMKKWKEAGLELYVFSSGSVQAQKLLFSHSTEGDLTPLFTNYYDTRTGGKRVSSSYITIAENMGLLPEKILFLSDTIEEINAAQAAGLQTLLLCRDSAPEGLSYQWVQSFDQIDIE